MPAPLAVDREQVRMLAMTIGVREAARKLGIAEGTVQAWAARGDWFAATRPQPALQPLPPSVRPVSVSSGATIATKPVDALASILAEDSSATRTAGSKFARKVTEYAAQLPDAEALAASRNVKEAVGVAQVIHGWDQASTAIRINVYADLRDEKPVIDV